MKKLSFPSIVRMGFKVIFVFLLFAGLNFGTQSDGEFYGKEVALENAFAGSGSLKYVYGTIVVCGGGGCDTFNVCRYGPGFC